MKGVKNLNDENKIGYYAIIPSTVLFDTDLKANEKLLYAIIKVLSNKEGYCFASNSYLGNLLNAQPHTISKWVSHLKEKGCVRLDLIRNDKFEIHLKNRFLTPYGILVSSYPISLFQNEN